MSKRVTPVILVLLCVFLDTIVFARVNLVKMRPDAMLAASVSFGVLHGFLPGAVLGAAGGLVSDLIGGASLGLNAAMYLIAGAAGGFFYKKFYADNVIVPALTTVAAGLFKEIFMSIVAFLSGARFSFGSVLLQYILPCALFSALLCILLHIVLKPLAAKQIKRQHAEH